MENKLQLKTCSESITKSSPRSLIDIYRNPGTSIAKIRKSEGVAVAKSMLLKKVVELIEISGAELSEMQIDNLIGFILIEYYFFSVEDFELIKYRLMRLKTYGAPKVQDLTNEIDQYWNEKAEFIEKQRRSEYKDTLTHEDVLRSYGKICNEKKVDQKARDNENRENNDNKIRELKEKGLL